MSCTSAPTFSLTTAPYTVRFPYSYSQNQMVTPLSFLKGHLSANNLDNSKLKLKSWEVRQSVPIPFSNFWTTTCGGNLYRCYFQNAICIYKTLVNLSLSENYSFVTLWLNFLEITRKMRQNRNGFEVSAQCFRDAGTSQLFMLSGLNLKCCWVISTSTKYLCPLVRKIKWEKERYVELWHLLCLKCCAASPLQEKTIWMKHTEFGFKKCRAVVS